MTTLSHEKGAKARDLGFLNFKKKIIIIIIIIKIILINYLFLEVCCETYYKGML